MRIFCFFLFLIITQAQVFACTVTDDLGFTIQLKTPAKRIISLAPDLTEILFAVGAGNQIIGTVLGSDYPIEALRIPIVATDHSINAEAIVRLHPDLIVAWSETSLTPQLKKLGIPVYLSRPEHLSDIPKTIQRLSCLVGKEHDSQKIIAAFLRKEAQLKKNLIIKKPVTVFYQIWSYPLMTITKKSWINEVIALCGGRNIFAELKGTVASVDREAVLVANPDLIIVTQKKMVKEWPGRKTVYLNPDLIDRAGPRIMNGVEKMCLIIQHSPLSVTSV